MDSFRCFLESLKFGKQDIMKSHPYYIDATFGVEVEFLCVGIPEADFNEKFLAKGLRNSPYEEEMKQKWAKDNPEYDPDEDWSNVVFQDIIYKNPKGVIDQFYKYVQSGDFNPDELDTEWLDAVVHYWYMKFRDAIRQSGFKVEEGKHSKGSFWAIGADGHDTVYNIPVIEIRTGILQMSDLPKFQKALEAIIQIVRSNRRELMAAGNTGLHIHVHNAKTANDMFSRLAIAQHADEDAIWDSQARYDRDFIRHALLNKQSDFEYTAIKGAHSYIMRDIDNLFDKITKNTIVVSNDFLGRWLKNPEFRNVGINFRTEHPTVEYRYLSSETLLAGSEKVVKWIEYFVANSASLANKDQIKFEDDEMSYVLTRLQGNRVRIDRIFKQGRLPNIARTGQTTSSLAQMPSANREKWEPTWQWWQRLKPNERQRELERKGIT